MSRIYNTTFNNLAGDTSVGNETQIVVNGTLNARKKNYNGLFTMSDTYNYLSLSQFENSIASQNNTIQFANTLSTNQTIFFGVDTMEFITYLESLFGFSNKISGVTNVTNVTLIYLPLAVPPTQTVTFSSNSATYNYLKFNPGGGNPISNSLVIFNGVNSVVMTITANYSSGTLQSIELSV